MNQDTQRDEPQCYLHGSVPSKATSAANTSATNITTTISAIKACWENTCAHATLANPRYGDKKNKILIQQKHTHTQKIPSSHHLAISQHPLKGAFRGLSEAAPHFTAFTCVTRHLQIKIWHRPGNSFTQLSPPPTPQKKTREKKNPIKDYTG